MVKDFNILKDHQAFSREYLARIFMIGVFIAIVAHQLELRGINKNHLGATIGYWIIPLWVGILIHHFFFAKKISLMSTYIMIFSIALATSCTSWFMGGLATDNIFWIITFPIGAALLLGKRGAFLGGGVSLLTTTIFVILTYTGFESSDFFPTNQSHITYSYLLSIKVTLVTILFIFMTQSIFHRITSKMNYSRQLVKNLILIISTDIKQHINTIEKSTKKILSSISDKSSTDYAHFNTMLRANDNIRKIMENSLNLDQVSDQSGTIEIELIEPQKLIDSINFCFYKPLRDKSINLIIKNDLQSSCKISANFSIFSNQILSNLISNAIKFSHENSDIFLNIYQNNCSEDLAYFDIVDNGIGIPNEIKNTLFSPHTKTSRLGTKGEKGTGFGMPIVKQFLAKLGGEISIKNNPTGGTIFTISIPCIKINNFVPEDVSNKSKVPQLDNKKIVSLKQLPCTTDIELIKLNLKAKQIVLFAFATLMAIIIGHKFFTGNADNITYLGSLICILAIVSSVTITKYKLSYNIIQTLPFVAILGLTMLTIGQNEQTYNIQIFWIILMPIAGSVLIGRAGTLLGGITTILSLVIISIAKLTENYSGPLPDSYVTYRTLLLLAEIIMTTICTYLLHQFIETAAKTIAEKNEQIKMLLRIIGHDILNSLTIIDNYCQLCDLTCAKTREKQFFIDSDEYKGIKNSTNEILKIVSHMRNVAAIDSGKKDIILSNERLTPIIDDLIKQLSDDLAKKDLELCFPSSLSHAHTCALIEKEIFKHDILKPLLQNAIKYSYSGNKINISMAENKKSVTISITDNGTGISEQHQKVLKENNSLFSMPGTKGEKGVGLGLVLVKSFLNLTHGNLEITSRPEVDFPVSHGTTIKLILSNVVNKITQ